MQLLYSTCYLICEFSREPRLKALADSDFFVLSSGWVDLIPLALANIAPGAPFDWKMRKADARFPLFAFQSVYDMGLLARCVGLLMAAAGKMVGHATDMHADRTVSRFGGISARFWSTLMSWCRHIFGMTKDELDAHQKLGKHGGKCENLCLRMLQLSC
jgi:hypothetical protein